VGVRREETEVHRVPNDTDVSIIQEAESTQSGIVAVRTEPELEHELRRQK
jgi:hypothetical protein